MNRDNLSNKLFVYDPTTNEWTEGANLPTERGALTANFINGILYAVGGVDKSETLTSTLAYDPRTNTWTEKAPMPTARETYIRNNQWKIICYRWKDCWYVNECRR